MYANHLSRWWRAILLQFVVERRECTNVCNDCSMTPKALFARTVQRSIGPVMRNKCHPQNAATCPISYLIHSQDDIDFVEQRNPSCPAGSLKLADPCGYSSQSMPTGSYSQT
jgi:hypothetical protein